MRIDIESLAERAQIALRPGEAARLAEELPKVLAMIRALEGVPTEGASSPVMGEGGPAVAGRSGRADIPGPTLSQAEVLAGAPEQAEGYFVVPKVF